MTNEQKYTELLKELASIIKHKNDTIALQAWQISDLKSKLESAETDTNKF